MLAKHKDGHRVILFVKNKTFLNAVVSPSAEIGVDPSEDEESKRMHPLSLFPEKDEAEAQRSNASLGFRDSHGIS